MCMECRSKGTSGASLRTSESPKDNHRLTCYEHQRDPSINQARRYLTHLHAVVRMELTIRVMSNTVVERHQQRIDVLEALELRLINLFDDTIVVRRQVDRLFGELRRKVGQVSVVFQPRLEWRHDLLLFQLENTIKVVNWRCGQRSTTDSPSPSRLF